MSDILEQLASAPVEGTQRLLLDLAIGEIQSLRNELRNNQRLANHDHCDVCDRPQWVMPNGEHRCKSFEELQYQYEKDTELITFWQKFSVDLQNKLHEIEAELKAHKEATDSRNRNN